MLVPRLRRVIWAWRVFCVFLLSTGAFGFVSPVDSPTEDAEKIFVLEVQGEIDLGVAPYVRRMLKEARQEGSKVVVLDINTPGGRLDAAIQIKNAIIGSEIPVVAFINREAFSAGALIALAADRIYMTPGSVLGSATPVDPRGIEASEKIISAVRKEFKSMAELRGRFPELAEAMVDSSVVIDGLTEEGKLLSLTAEEALNWGYAEGMVENLNELGNKLELEGVVFVYKSPSLAEKLVRILTTPAIASLLISLGFLGVMFELLSPGFGLPGIIGIALLVLFFWGHVLAGLAGWEGIILVLLGVFFLGVELLFVPGFGLFGLLGVGSFVFGVFISLVASGSTGDDFQRAGFVIIQSFIVILIAIFLATKFLPRGRLFRGLVLDAMMRTGPGIEEPSNVPLTDLREDRRAGSSPSRSGPLYGYVGVALTDLSPGGWILINNERIDVVTEGNFVPVGSSVMIVLDERYRRVVRKVDKP